jgi:hypothetical protein
VPGSLVARPKFAALPLSALRAGERRLDAENYLTDGYLFRLNLARLPGAQPLDQRADVWQPARLKGIQVAPEHGIPFLAATQVFDVRPAPRKWLAAERTPDLARRYVEPGWALVTCSGTVGDAILAYRAHKGLIISHDLLRVVPKRAEDLGYLYAFLRTRYARGIMHSTKYGKVIKHLETEHLHDVPVPDLGGDLLRVTLDDNIRRCFALRDEAYTLVREAEELLAETIGLPDPPQPETGFGVRASEMSLVSRRLEAGAYHPRAVAALKALERSGKPIDRLRDVTARIFGVARFQHVYTDAGTPYLDSEELFKVNPEPHKFIPPGAKRDAVDYLVQAGWLLMACSGQTYGLNGSAVLATPWHENKIVSNHVLRIVPKDIRSGYLLMMLTHPTLGRPLVLRLAFGTSVPEIDAQELRATPVVRLGDVEYVIADKVERASALRIEADAVENAATALLEATIARALGDTGERDVQASPESEGKWSGGATPSGAGREGRAAIGASGDRP